MRVLQSGNFPPMHLDHFSSYRATDVTNVVGRAYNYREESMKPTTLLQVTLGLGALLGLTACTKPSEEPTVTTSNGSTSTAPSGAEARKANVALVRFLNATPASRDLYFGDSKPFASVRAQSISPYVELPSESH